MTSDTTWTDHGDEPLSARVLAAEVEPRWVDLFGIDPDYDEGATDLRDAIAAAVEQTLLASDDSWTIEEQIADAVLSLPQIAAVLAARPVAAQERIDAALKLADEWERDARAITEGGPLAAMQRVQLRGDARDLRRALTGDAQ